MNTIDINNTALKLFKEQFNRNAYGWKDIAVERVNEQITREFELGVSTPTLMDATKIDDVKLLDADLKVIDSNRRLRDKFLNRLIIPIRDELGFLVGFGGRSLKDSGAKYINTSSSLTFEKRKLLYGLDKSYEYILKDGYAILVEGYFGVMQLYKHDIKNVVASCGTSFTDEQATLLNRYTDYVYICYDGDQAGEISTLRAITKLLSKGMKSFVIKLPSKYDPDDYVKKYGEKKFQELIDVAIPEYKLISKYYIKEETKKIIQEWVSVVKGTVYEDAFIEKIPKNIYKLLKK